LILRGCARPSPASLGCRWGNRIEIVGYDNIQFTKAPNVLRGMGLSHLSKNEKAIKELRDKGMA
jgi:lactoylglutathione lyase